MAFLQFADNESATFGLNIWRCDARCEIDAILAASPAPDIVVIRDTVARMQRSPLTCGVALDVAWRDHILTFKKELKSTNLISPTGLRCELGVIQGHEWATVEALCTENFSGYPGHFQLSPYLDGTRAALGMVRWLEQLHREDAEGVYVLRQDDKVIGVLGFSYREQAAELAVAAIAADAGLRHRNLFLMEATRQAEQRLLLRSNKYFVAKTQATNTSIQRDLVHYVHCEPAVTRATAHANLFLGKIPYSGKEIRFVESLHTSVLNHAQENFSHRQLQTLNVYSRAEAQITLLRGVAQPRNDKTEALFFAGYNAKHEVVAVASVLLV